MIKKYLLFTIICSLYSPSITCMQTSFAHEFKNIFSYAMESGPTATIILKLDENTKQYYTIDCSLCSILKILESYDQKPNPELLLQVLQPIKFIEAELTKLITKDFTEKGAWEFIDPYIGPHAQKMLNALQQFRMKIEAATQPLRLKKSGLDVFAL